MIIGHQKQWSSLMAYVQRRKVPHALLFSGEESLGKKRVALEFLKSLNCFARKQRAGGGPCQICPSCKAIEKGIHPDFFFVKPKNGTIGISQVRGLSESLVLKPFFQWKTAILDQAHLMTGEAQNCLLKTLEEPTGRACLILISEHPFFLLTTILSRAQEVKFFPVKKRTILNYLQTQGIEHKRAQEMTEFSFGRPGQAIEFLSKPQKLKEQKLQIEHFLSLFQSDLAQRFHYAKRLAGKSEDLKEIFDSWLNYLRQSLILKINKKDFGEAKKIKMLLWQITEVRPLILNKSINKRLALENLFLKI